MQEDPKALLEVTCKHCCSRLQYAPVDVKEYHGRDYSGGFDGKQWINCPKCSHEVILKAW